MNKIIIEDCLNVVDNRFMLVILASVRARQLMKGSRPLVKDSTDNELITALREISMRKVYLDKN